jgi:hypothetical protein
LQLKKAANRKYISLAINLLFTMMVVYYFAVKVQPAQKQFSALYQPRFLFIVLLMALLTIFNWWLEVWKWKALVRLILPATPLKKITQSVLAGVSFAVFTPARIGEVLARIFYLPFPNRLKAAVLHSCSSFAQFVATLVFGAASIILAGVSEVPSWLFGFACMAGLVGLSGLFFMTSPSLILQRTHLLPKKIRDFIPEQFNGLPPLFFTRQLALSFIRFGIYVLQYSIFLHYFNAFPSLWHCINYASAYFLLISFLPGFALTELGIRGGVAVFLSHLFQGNEWIALTGSVLLWIVNVGLTSLIGLRFLYQIKWFSGKS